MSSFRICRIGTTLGKTPLSNFDKFGGQADKLSIENAVGILTTHHKLPSEAAPDLCVRAFERLQSASEVDLDLVDLLVVVSQHTQPNIPPISARLAGALGLGDKIYNLDLSIGCTGFVQGVHVVSEMARALNARSALLFNVETLSDVLNPEDQNTNFIFSDAATATWLSSSAPGILPVKFNFSTSGKDSLALHSTPRHLRMDGLAVYNYVARNVPAGLKALLADSGLGLEELHAIFFHQASLRTVDKLRRVLSLGDVKMPFSAGAYGNAGSCSIPFLLQEFWADFQGAKGKHAAFCSFGAGLSYANCLVRYDW